MAADGTSFSELEEDLGVVPTTGSALPPGAITMVILIIAAMVAIWLF